MASEHSQLWSELDRDVVAQTLCLLGPPAWVAPVLLFIFNGGAVSDDGPERGVGCAAHAPEVGGNVSPLLAVLGEMMPYCRSRCPSHRA